MVYLQALVLLAAFALLSACGNPTQSRNDSRAKAGEAKPAEQPRREENTLTDFCCVLRFGVDAAAKENPYWSDAQVLRGVRGVTRQHNPQWDQMWDLCLMDTYKPKPYMNRNCKFLP